MKVTLTFSSIDSSLKSLLVTDIKTNRYQLFFYDAFEVL